MVTLCLVAGPVTAVGVGGLALGPSGQVDLVGVGNHALDDHRGGLDIAVEPDQDAADGGVCAVDSGGKDGVDED